MRLKCLLSFLTVLLIMGFAQVMAADEEPTLLVHYSFEGDLTDGSGNGNDAVAKGTSGTPVFGETDGRKGKYLDLSGNTDNAAAALFIQTPDSVVESSDDAYAVMGWAKINSPVGRMQIVNQPADTNTLKQFIMKWSNAAEKPWISGYIPYGSGWYHSSPSDMLNWFHFAIVVDPAKDTMDIWYDGVHAKGVSAPFGDTVAPFFFGAMPGGNEANDGFFDEIYIFKGKVTGDDILKNISAADNLIVQYSFEGDLLDGSGNGNNAKPLGTSPTAVYSASDGLKGKYLDLSGNTDNAAASLFISTPDSILTNAEAYTISGWHKINNPVGRMQIVNQPADTGTTKQFIMKWSNAAEKPWISGFIPYGSGWYHSSPSDMLNWFHFAIVVDPAKDTMDIWYDGVHAKAVSAPFGDTVAPFFFGAFPSGNEANDGFYDEISIYNKALSGDEIMDLYMANKPCDKMDLTVMNNDTALYIAPVAGATYQWIDCSDGSVVAGATDTLYAPGTSGEFKVAVAYQGDCADTSACASITICDPIDVTVMKNDTALYVASTTGATYQWIDCSDGSAISGATDTLYEPDASGEFKVAVTLSAECSDTSACTAITISTGIDRMRDLGVAVYPNPVSDILMIDLGTHARGEISLINLVGQTVLRTSLDKQHARFDLSNMEDGLYLLKVTVEEGSSTLRILKQ